MFIIGKYISNDVADEAKKAAMAKQLTDSIRAISDGLLESVTLGDKYSDAKKRLDARFDLIKKAQPPKL